MTREWWTSAAVRHEHRTKSLLAIPPRSISFKGILQTLEAFQPLIAYRAGCGSDHRNVLYRQLLAAIVVHRVVDRLDHFEPHARKRNPRKAHVLMKPRHGQT